MNGEKIVDKIKLKLLRNRVQAELNKVGEEIGCKIDLGNIRYSDNSATSKITVSELIDGNAMTPEAEAFLMLCHLHGLAKDDLFRPFMKDGVEYKIIGYKSRATKKPFQIMRIIDSKQYVANEHFVVSGLGYPPMAKTGYEE